MLRVIESLDHLTTPTSNFGRSCCKLIAGSIIGLASFKNIEGMLIGASVAHLEIGPKTIRPRTILISSIVFAALKMVSEQYFKIPQPLSFGTAFIVGGLSRNPDVGGMLIGAGFWGLGAKYALFPVVTYIVNYHFDKFLAISQICCGATIGQLLPHVILLPERENIMKLAFFSLIATTLSVTSYYFNHFYLTGIILGSSILLCCVFETDRALSRRANQLGVAVAPVAVVGGGAAALAQIPQEPAVVADLPLLEPMRQEAEAPLDMNGSVAYSNHSPSARRGCSAQSMSNSVRPAVSVFPASQKLYPMIGGFSFAKGVPSELKDDMVFSLANCMFTGNRIFDFALDPTDFNLYERSWLELWVRERGTSPQTREALSVEQIRGLDVLNAVMRERAEFYEAKLSAGQPIAQLLQTPPQHSAKIRDALRALKLDNRFDDICQKLRTILHFIGDPKDWEWPVGQIPPKLFDDSLFSLFICQHSKKPICNFVFDGDQLYEENEVRHIDKEFKKLNVLTGLVRQRMKAYKALILANAPKEEIERLKRTPPDAKILNGVLDVLRELYPDSDIYQRVLSLLHWNM